MTTTQQLLIAFASTDGVTVDGHFGSCEQFDIAELIADCHLMFCASIGGPAAARVIRAGIHPMKCKPVNETAPEITVQLSLLQERMKSGSLPPWLGKLTGQADLLSSRFESLA